MTVKSLLKKFSITLALICILIGCTTDDILPALELNTNETVLSEAGGSLSLSAVLNSAASQQISIPLIFSGTAVLSEDYSVSAAQIVIEAGNESGNVIFSGLQDNVIEGTETIIVQISNAQDVLLVSETQIEISLLDDDVDTDEDGIPDNVDSCPEQSGFAEYDGCLYPRIIINEVLYDPSNQGLNGDANGDEFYAQNDDEFIEFYNLGSQTVDISGFTISDATQLRHVFPEGTLVPSHSVLVLFGGGNPTGDFGGATVQIASEGLLNMNNAGDLVTFADSDGNTVLTFDVEPLSNNPNESYSRNPDLTGEFEQHAGIPEANGALFSPGTRTDGSSF